MPGEIIDILLAYKYAILLPLTIIEGPLVMMVAGFAIRLGGLEFWPTYVLVMIGDLLADIMWYCVGYFWGMPFVRKWGKYLSISEHKVETVERFFHRHSIKILVISKLTMGFGFALVTLIAAGMVKIPFLKYLTLNLVGGFIWTAILMAIGYFFGNAYLSIDHVLGRISVIALFIIIFFCLIGFGKYLGRRVTGTEI